MTNLEQLYDMTAHPGWKLLVEDVLHRTELQKDFLSRNETSAYQQGVIHGAVKIYRELASLREMIDQALKMEQDEASDV